MSLERTKEMQGIIYLVELESDVIKVGMSIRPNNQRLAMWGKHKRAIVYHLKAKSVREIKKLETVICQQFQVRIGSREHVLSTLPQVEEQADLLIPKDKLINKENILPTVPSKFGRPRIGYPVSIVITAAQKQWLKKTKPEGMTMAAYIRVLLEKEMKDQEVKS